MNFVPQSFLAIFWYPVTDGALTDFVLIVVIPFFFMFFKQDCCCLRIQMQMEISQALFHKEAQLVRFRAHKLNSILYTEFGKG